MYERAHTPTKTTVDLRSRRRLVRALGLLGPLLVPFSIPLLGGALKLCLLLVGEVAIRRRTHLPPPTEIGEILAMKRSPFRLRCLARLVLIPIEARATTTTRSRPREDCESLRVLRIRGAAGPGTVRPAVKLSKEVTQWLKRTSVTAHAPTRSATLTLLMALIRALYCSSVSSRKNGFI